MLRILHQIHTFVNSKLGSSQSNFYASNCIKTKLSRRIPVKPGRHQSIHLWSLSSNHYPGYLMKKLTFIIRGEGRLHSTGFSTSPPIVVLKGGKPHASISKQSADGLDNLSCVSISEWEYIFRVTYIL